MSENSVNSNVLGNGADSNTMQLLHECYRSYLIPSHSDIGYGSAGLGGDYIRNAMSYKIYNGQNTVARVQLKDLEGNLRTPLRMPINCSTFVNLMLLGVPYEHSRYYKEDPYRVGHSEEATLNDSGAAGYYCHLLGEPVDANNYGQIQYCQDLYNRFNQLGRGFVPAEDLSDVRPGDVLFVGDENFEMNHVGIVMARLGYYDKNNTAKPLILYAHVCGSEDKSPDFPVCAETISYDQHWANGNFNSDKSIRYIGRPEYITTRESKPELLAAYDAACQNIALPVRDVKNCEILTFEADWKPTSSDERIYLVGDDFKNSSKDGANSHTVTLRTDFPVIAGETYHVVMPFSIKHYNSNNNTWLIKNVLAKTACGADADSPQSSWMKNIRIYRGLRNGLSESVVRELCGAGIELQAGDDLNDLPIGKAHAPYGGLTEDLDHCPTAVNFSIWTFYRTANCKTQVLVDVNGDIFVRSQSLQDAAIGTYGNWCYHFESVKMQNELYSAGTELQASDDMNDLPVGKAYALTNAIADAIKHSPTIANFTVWTFYRTENLKTQVLIDSQDHVYIRSQYFNDAAAGTYQPWRLHASAVTDQNPQQTN